MSCGRLRILYHHRIAAADGMRVHVDEVVGALRARGHLVKVVGPGASGQAGGRSGLERGSERLRGLLPSAVHEILELAYNLPAYLRLRRAAKTFKPDVLYERYNLFLLAGLWFAEERGLPMLLEINSPLASERARFGGLRLKRTARRCEAAVWRRADVVMPVTRVLARQVRRVRRMSSDIHVIPNGADLTRRPGEAGGTAARLADALPPDALVLGFVGFVRAWHGVGWAVDALPDLPSRVHLVVVGDGPGLQDVAARVQALGVQARTHLLGRVPHDEIDGLMARFDVALQIAATPYASPLKLFEYMALGLAVVAPDQPNIREVLTDGRDALLFPPQDEAGFRAALKRVCGDDLLRARLGAGALRTVRETPFTWAHNAERIEALACGLITAKTGRWAWSRARASPGPPLP